MWISEDGRINTNVWADPSAVLPEPVLTFIESLDSEARERLADAIEAAIMSTVDLADGFAARTTPEIERPFVREWMPPEVLQRLIPSSLDDLMAQVAAIDLRWRIDAYQVVDDYLTNR